VLGSRDHRRLGVREQQIEVQHPFDDGRGGHDDLANDLPEHPVDVHRGQARRASRETGAQASLSDDDDQQRRRRADHILDHA
jgi:hypothetical protein